MKYNYTVKQDGQTYPPGTDVPEYGEHCLHRSIGKC